MLRWIIIIALGIIFAQLILSLLPIIFIFIPLWILAKFTS